MNTAENLRLFDELSADIEAIQRISAVPSILGILLESTGLGYAAVARVTKDAWIACAVLDKIGFGLGVGGELDVATTFCSEIRASAAPIVIDKASEDPTYRTHRTPQMYGFESYIAVPIVMKSGEVFGTICALDPAPAYLSEPKTVRTLELFAKLIASQLEVDELLAKQRRELRHQQLLLGEMNHRVKNTLTIVQNIARQSLRSERPLREARAAFDARLQTLAAAHSLMIESGWQAVLVHDLLIQTLAPFGAEDLARFDIDGPEMRLAPPTAVSFSLAIHELATNAAKYGALSNETGMVSIRWWLSRQGGEGRLKLQWTETGGPPVAAPAARGFGSRLIERGLSAELGGSVTIDFKPDGVRCTINAPAPYVAPAAGRDPQQAVLFPLP